MSFTGSDNPSITYKYPRTVHKRREKKYCCIDTPRCFHKSLPHSPLDLPILKCRYQHTWLGIRSTRAKLEDAADRWVPHVSVTRMERAWVKGGWPGGHAWQEPDCDGRGDEGWAAHGVGPTRR
jgi:hypothetical protein